MLEISAEISLALAPENLAAIKLQLAYGATGRGLLTHFPLDNSNTQPRTVSSARRFYA